MKNIIIKNNEVIKEGEYSEKEGYILEQLVDTNNMFHFPDIISFNKSKVHMKKINAMNFDYAMFDNYTILGCMLNKFHETQLPEIEKTEFSLEEYFLYKLKINIKKFSKNIFDKKFLKNLETFINSYINKSKLVSEYGLTHGDFCHNNLLLGKDEIFLIDFEKTIYGYQIDDVAQFCAKMLIKTHHISSFDFEKAENCF